MILKKKKKKGTNHSKVNIDDVVLPISSVNVPILENPDIKFKKIATNDIGINLLQHDL